MNLFKIATIRPFSVLLICLMILNTLEAKPNKMPPFSLPIYKGAEAYTYPLKKKKTTLVNFWASWCTSCIQEIPELEELKKRFPEVEFLAVNAGDTKKKIKKFLKKTGFSYKTLMDKDKSFSKGLGVLSLPITMVIDKEGKIIYHSTKPPKSINTK
jgi:thiol-disulfide isomerase/thioredoxin